MATYVDLHNTLSYKFVTKLITESAYNSSALDNHPARHSTCTYLKNEGLLLHVTEETMQRACISWPIPISRATTRSLPSRRERERERKKDNPDQVRPLSVSHCHTS